MTSSERIALANWLGKVAEISRVKHQHGDTLITFPLNAETVKYFKQAAEAVGRCRRSVFDSFATGCGSPDLLDALEALEVMRKNDGKPMSAGQMQAVIDLLEKYGRTPEEWVRLMRGGDATFERELGQRLEDVK